MQHKIHNLGLRVKFREKKIGFDFRQWSFSMNQTWNILLFITVLCFMHLLGFHIIEARNGQKVFLKLKLHWTCSSIDLNILSFRCMLFFGIPEVAKSWIVRDPLRGQPEDNRTPICSNTWEGFFWNDEIYIIW